MNLLTEIFRPVVAFVQVFFVLFGFQPVKQHQALPAEGPVNVMLTGLLGYGEDVGLSFAQPYFGTTQPFMDTCEALEAKGYESYTADIGPFSSAWDRACELYAILTGTRVDYGEAHSREYGHERYGRDYAKPLFEGWSAKRQVNLIGHSFGGTTARVFAMLCDEGSAAERAATSKAQRSPLFDGGLLNRINAIVTLASPHNGSTAAICIPDDYCEIEFLWLIGGLNLMGNSRVVSRLYDLQLDHFHISAPPRTFGQRRDGWYCVDDVRHFLQCRDNVLYDLSLDGAAKLNAADKIRPGVKYLSYSSSLTKDVLGFQLPPLPNGFLGLFLWPFSVQMGLGLSKTPLPGPEWRENDGAVPLPSAFYPAGQPHQDAPAGPIPPGIWNVMPTVYGVNHSYLASGDPARQSAQEILDLYLDIMERIG